MKTVAVVIVNWNSWALLARCMEGLATQTYKDFSVTIIDNASSDEMPAQLLAAYPQVNLVRNIANLGFAAGNNLALRKFTGGSEWVALINPDAIPEPCWLEALLNSRESNPEFDAFGSKLVNAADSTLLDGTGDAYHISGRVWRTAHGVPVSHLGESECEIFSPCAAAALYRRSALLEVGGFDEDFFCYVDDLIDAMVKMMNSEDGFTGPVNIGNPGEFTMLQLAETVLKLSGSKSKIIHQLLPLDDPKQRQPNIELAKAKLGWHPKVNLEDGLKETIAYFRKVVA